MRTGRRSIAACAGGLALVVAALSAAATAPASAAEPPIPPIEADRCQTQQDHVDIPPMNGGNTYYVNGEYAGEGLFPIPASAYTNADGSATVKVKADGMYGTEWTFVYDNNGSCGPEATNTLSIGLGPCNSNGTTEVLATYINQADSTTWIDQDVSIEAYSKERNRSEGATTHLGQIRDGASVTLDMFDVYADYANGYDAEGMPPGTYVFTARTARGFVVSTPEIRIEGCGGMFSFPGTPPLDPAGSLAGKVSARIIVGSGGVHKACMDARKVPGRSKVQFRVDRKFAGKTKIIREVAQRAGTKDCYKVRAKGGSKLFVTVRNPDTGGWSRLLRKRIRG